MTEIQEPDPSSATGKLRRQVESAHKWLAVSGSGVPGLGIFLFYWKKLGLIWSLPLVFLIAAPLGGYSALAHTTSSVIPDWVGDFGVHFTARDWHIDLMNLSVTARGVSISRTDGDKPVLTADELVFDGNLRTLTRGMFSPGGYYHHITLRRGQLHLEQSRTGDWNWMQFLDAVPADRRTAALAGLYQIDGLFIDDLDIVYIEHVRSGSGGDVSETSTATIHVDDVTGSILGLRRAPNPDERPTSFDITARTAGGRLELKGDAALFAPPARTQGATEAPFFGLRLRFDTIGMAALARMLPTTRVAPVGGSITGRVNLDRTASGLACTSEVTVSELQLAANPRLVTDRAELARVTQDLSTYRMSGPYDACRPLSDTATEPTEGAHTMSAQMASFNAQTTEGASPGVRLLAALDQRHLAGVVGGRILGGMKSLGSGIIRAFGGRNENEAASPTGSEPVPTTRETR